MLAAPRGFSQPSTSFIGPGCQGIHHQPFLAQRRRSLNQPRRQDQRSRTAHLHSRGRRAAKTSNFTIHCVDGTCSIRPRTRNARGACNTAADALLNYSFVVQVRLTYRPAKACRRSTIRLFPRGSSSGDNSCWLVFGYGLAHASGIKTARLPSGPNGHAGGRFRTMRLLPLVCEWSRLLSPGRLLAIAECHYINWPRWPATEFLGWSPHPRVHCGFA